MGQFVQGFAGARVDDADHCLFAHQRPVELAVGESAVAERDRRFAPETCGNDDDAWVAEQPEPLQNLEKVVGGTGRGNLYHIPCAVSTNQMRDAMQFCIVERVGRGRLHHYRGIGRPLPNAGCCKAQPRDEVVGTAERLRQCQTSGCTRLQPPQGLRGVRDESRIAAQGHGNNDDRCAVRLRQTRDEIVERTADRGDEPLRPSLLEESQVVAVGALVARDQYGPGDVATRFDHDLRIRSGRGRKPACCRR